MVAITVKCWIDKCVLSPLKLYVSIMTAGYLRIATLALWVLPCLIGTDARADTVQLEGLPPVDGIKLSGLASAQILYQASDGRHVTLDLSRIAFLQFNRWPLFNLAEKQRLAGNTAMAVNTYEKVIDALGRQARVARPMLPSGWTQEDLRLLVQCRLISACAASDRFDLAVETYLDVLARMPEALEPLRPEISANVSAEHLRAAEAHLAAALKGSLDEKARASLSAWSASWPSNGTSLPRDTEPRSVVPTTPRASSHGGTRSQRFHQRMREIVDAFERGRFNDVMRDLDELAARDPLLPAEWYYWRGRTHEALAEQMAANEREVALRLGGLAYLRVVIHFPEHRSAPECLYRAGAIAAQMGAAEQAATLWRETARRWPDVEPWSRRAADMLERIKTP